jgi:hypothetical protein
LTDEERRAFRAAIANLLSNSKFYPACFSREPGTAFELDDRRDRPRAA